MSSGKCKFIQQWSTTTFLLEGPKSGILTTPDSGEHVEPQNNPADWKDSSLPDACRTKQHTVTIGSTKSTLSTYPKEIKKMMLTQKPAHVCV